MRPDSSISGRRLRPSADHDSRSLVENNHSSVDHPENRRAGPMGVAEANRQEVERGGRTPGSRRAPRRRRHRSPRRRRATDHSVFVETTAITQRAPSACVPTPPDRRAGSAPQRHPTLVNGGPGIFVRRPLLQRAWRGRAKADRRETETESHQSQVKLGSLTSLSLTASLTRSLTQCRLKGGDPRLQVSHAGIEIDESKGWR
jgi:hypothetical protein